MVQGCIGNTGEIMSLIRREATAEKLYIRGASNYPVIHCRFIMSVSGAVSTYSILKYPHKFREKDMPNLRESAYETIVKCYMQRQPKSTWTMHTGEKFRPQFCQLAYVRRTKYLS